MKFKVFGCILGILSLPIVSSRVVSAQEPVKIGFSVRVKNYSEWIRVDPGCKSGDKVIRTSGGFVTDRIARDKKFRVVINDLSFTKKCKCSFILEARVKRDTNKTIFRGDITIPFTREQVMSVDPEFDNLIIEVFDDIAPNSVVSRRVPIGSR